MEQLTIFDKEFVSFLAQSETIILILSQSHVCMVNIKMEPESKGKVNNAELSL